ncbi:MAG: glycosyltransferase [Phycisphaerae bacterium]|jgi:chlorobactene glucosyltransferase|nr:glycosyltransferase [Phycisphaerae bacterium]
MAVIITILLVYLSLNTLIWFFRHKAISRAKITAENLDSGYNVDQTRKVPKVSVLVAGKNEEKNIERCLRSLLAQNYPDLEIIAINDRSDDRTGAIMDQVAAESQGRLRVVHIETLPQGWLGKPHAMHQGAKLATGEYLLFTDADCFFQCPDAVRISVEYAINKRVDLLSVLPVLETGSFWERVLQPVCSAIMMLWFRPEWVNDPARKVAYANGAFMLFTRSSYESIRGHESVKNHLNEDMEFARLIKGSSHQLYVVPNRDLYRTRMYDNFRGTYAGWSRIFYGCFVKPVRVVIVMAVLSLMSLVPYALFIAAVGWGIVSDWSFVHAKANWFLVLSFTAIVAQMSVLIRFYPLMGSPWSRALTYPLGAVVTLAILFNSLRKFRGGKIIWRGSEIKGMNV